jgi:hypothetical protein
MERQDKQYNPTHAAKHEARCPLAPNTANVSANHLPTASDD